MITHTIVTVTPKMATGWLNDCNIHNRSVSNVVVQDYSGQMKSGKWHLNGEPIIFTAAKVKLLDGQHRLWACIDANTPFKTVVIEGIEEDTFSSIDTGKKRSAKDVLDIAGIEGTDNRALAAAATLLIAYRAGNLHAMKTVPRTKVLEFVEDNPDLQAWVIRARQIRGWSRTFASSLAAVTYLASHRMSNEAEEFVKQVTSGENLAPRSPALALRNRLASEKRLSGGVKMTMIIMAWNAFAKGRTLTKLQMPRQDDYPKIEGAAKR